MSANMTISTFSLGTLGTSIFDLKATDSCLVILFFSKLLHYARTCLRGRTSKPDLRMWRTRRLALHHPRRHLLLLGQIHRSATNDARSLLLRTLCHLVPHRAECSRLHWMGECCLATRTHFALLHRTAARSPSAA